MACGHVAGWLVFVVVVAAGCGIGAEMPGCGPVTEPIMESEKFTPYEQMRSHLPDGPLNPNGDMPVEAPAGVPQISDLGGLPLQMVDSAVDAPSAVYYFWDEPVVDVLYSEFTAGGGIQLAAEGGEELVSMSRMPAEQSQPPGRRVPVEVGPYIGLLTWGDPDANGLRPHHLLWWDGASNWTLLADRGPEDMVEMGRSLVCPG